jgi:hypothetical protein
MWLEKKFKMIKSIKRVILKQVTRRLIIGLLCFVSIEMVELLVTGASCASVLFALFLLLSEAYPRCLG